MKKFIIIFGLMLGLLSIGFLGSGAFAARGILPGICNTDDNRLFPNGMFCGSSPDINPSQATFLPTSTTTTSGSTVRFHGGYNAQGPAPSISNGGPNNQLSNGSRPQGQVLIWVWIDGPALLVNDLSITNIVGPAGTNGNASLNCPGDGGSGPGPVYNFRDTSGDYSLGAAQGVNNGDNASPSAYNPSNNSGLTDCGSSGRMVYWTNATNDPNAYSFDVKINNGRTGTFCVRMNVSVGFGSDVKYFPDSSNGSSPHQQNVVASHVARQSDEVCTTVNPNPPPTGVSGTCSNLSFGTDSRHNGVSTYTYISISKVRNISAPRPSGGNATQQVTPPQFYTGRVLGDDRVHNISYIPTDQSINVNLVRHYHQSYSSLTPAYRASIGNPSAATYNNNATLWPTYSYPTDASLRNATIPCFSATCSITTWGDGPGNIVLAGGTLHVSISLTNTGPQPLPNPLSGPYYLGVVANGSNYQLDPGGYPGLWPPGPGSPQTGYISFDIPNVNSSTTVTAQPTYLGHFSLGGPCPGSGNPITVYSEFEITPTADVCTPAAPTCSTEYPDGIDYITGITSNKLVNGVPQASSADRAPISGGLNSVPSNNTARNLAVGSNTILSGIFPATPPPVNAGDRYCARIQLNYTTGLVDSAGNVYPGSTNPAPPLFERCKTVINRPYFKVQKTGIEAGGDFSATNPACNSGGTLASWNNDSKGLNPGGAAGAGTNLTALARGTNIGVASAVDTITGQPPLALSFANTGVPLSPLLKYNPVYGGNFGGQNCLTDFVAPTSASADVEEYPVNTPVSGRVINSGENKAVYVTGDVYIENNITFGGSTSWSLGGGNKVPSFILKASGNIYVAPGVTQLDGIYVAGGTFFSCGLPSYAPVAKDNLYSDCKNQLTVVGMVVAKKLNLMRTYGSLRNGGAGAAAANACSNAGTRVPNGQLNNPAADPGGNALTCAAEVFRFSPEVYLGDELRTQPQNNGAIKYDAITGLPPIL